MKNCSNAIKVTMYVIMVVLFAMSSYIIILNIHHYRSLSRYIIVSEIDSDYSKYKENVNQIEDIVNNYPNKDSNDHLSLTKILNTMKKDGVYRLIPKTKLNYKDLYDLNEYFMEKLINDGWVSNIKKFDLEGKNENIIMMLVNNSNYLNSVLTNNSLILYDDNLDNKIEDNYNFILKNYMMYSEIILNICNGLGG